MKQELERKNTFSIIFVESKLSKDECKNLNKATFNI